MIFIYGLSQKKRKVYPTMRVCPTKPTLQKPFPKKKPFPRPPIQTAPRRGCFFFAFLSSHALAKLARMSSKKTQRKKQSPPRRRVYARLRSLLFILFFFIIYSLINHYNSTITPYFCFFFIICFNYIIFFLYLCIE